MTDTTSQEPSMEEILASIRRIISEEGEGAKPGAAPAAPASPSAPAADRRAQPAAQPMAQTMAAPRPMPAPSSAPAHAATDEEVLELSQPVRPTAPVLNPPPASPYRYQPLEPSRPSPSTGGDELMSAGSAGAAAHAFALLSGGSGGTPGLPPLPMGEGGRTIEDLVRETLRPLIKAWLDQNLPPLVERMVRAEIERLSRRG